MKKLLIIIVMIAIGTITPVQKTHAQIPIVDIIKAAVKAVINAVHLQIQRQQNKIIWLQNAQKTVENTMSKLKLDEICDWVKSKRRCIKIIMKSFKRSSRLFLTSNGSKMLHRSRSV